MAIVDTLPKRIAQQLVVRHKKGTVLDEEGAKRIVEDIKRELPDAWTPGVDRGDVMSSLRSNLAPGGARARVDGVDYDVRVVPTAELTADGARVLTEFANSFPL